MQTDDENKLRSRINNLEKQVEDLKGYKVFYENAPLPYQSLDKDGFIIDVNSAWLKLLNYHRKEVIGKPIVAFIHPEGQTYFYENFKEFKQCGHHHDVEFRIKHKAGYYLNVTLDGLIGYHPDGSFRQTYCLLKDITEQKKLQEKLQNSKAYYQNIYYNIPAMLHSIDADGILIDVSENWLRNFGFNREEVIGHKSIEFLTEESRNYIEQYELPKYFRTGYAENVPAEFIKKNGDVMEVLISAISEKDEQGNFLRSIATLHDVTERNQARRKLKESEEKFQDQTDFLTNVIESLTHPFYVINVDDYSIKLNNSVANLTQKSGAQTCYALTHNRGTPCEADKHPCPMNRVLRTKSPAVMEHLHQDSEGKDRIVEVYAYPVFDNKGEVKQMIEYNLDITERKKLMAKNLMLSRAIEQSPECIVITNKDGEIEYVNPMFEKVTGYSREEILGNNPSILQSGEHDKIFYQHLWNTILSGNNWYGEFYNKRKDGKYYWERASISPIIDNNNNITHFVAVKEDITEEKRIIKELEEAKERAEESDRLKSSFLANMSHEIRTPMNGIIGFSQLLKEKEFPREKQNEFLDIIYSKTQRLLRIINDIVDISKMDVNQLSLHKENVCLNEILQKLYETYKRKISQSGKKDLEITVNSPLKHNESYITTDPQRLEQILDNLLSNAIKFTDKGSIELGYTRQSSDNLLFFVKDTGIGISRKNQELIFHRFRQVDDTAHREYEGTGLGLTISKNLVELMGGAMWIDSAEGEGSALYFTLPYETRMNELTQ